MRREGLLVSAVGPRSVEGHPHSYNILGSGSLSEVYNQNFRTEVPLLATLIYIYTKGR